MADDNHTRYVRQFELAEQVSYDGRAEAQTARDYFDGNQFTSAQRALLKKRKQPIIWENLIRLKVEALCGLERQGRTDPKAYPRTPIHEQDANAATDALRYVADDQDIDIKKSRVFENMLVEGMGGVEVAVRQTRGGVIDPCVIQIERDRIYYDPHSRASDFSDAGFLGYVTWMGEAEALRFTAPGGKWAGKKDVIKRTMSSPFSSAFAGFDDKPSWAAWSDSKDRRVRINTHYHLVDGVWHRCIFTLAGELEESAPVAFLDDEGKPECPLILASAYVDRDNDRYGIVRDMIPIQDGVNKGISKFLHQISTARVRVSRTAGQDKEEIRKEMQRPDGVIVAESGEVEDLGNGGRDSGQFGLIQDMRATLKSNIGPNAYLAGKAGADQSGKAILAQQQAGMSEMAPLLDNLRHWTLRVFRQIWNRIRQYWVAERWIRVTDDGDNAFRFVGINQPPELTPEQAIAGAYKVRDALQAGQIDTPTAMRYVADLERMARTQNPVAELDVDIEIDEVTDSPTLQMEQYQDLMQLIGTGVIPVSPPLIRMLIISSQLREKPKLLQMVDQMEKQAAQPNPANDLAMQEKQANVVSKQAGAVKDQAEAQLATARAIALGMGQPMQQRPGLVA